jgi:SAM-dependent methyltransferase
MNKPLPDEYSGFFAEFYDILHSHTHDVLSLIHIAQKQSGYILELGLGTGRIAIPLAKAGLSVTGIELSSDMMHIAEQKLSKENDQVRDRCKIIQADASNFSINTTFGFIIASCNFLNHFTTSCSIRSLFRCVKNHLSENGVFLIDQSMPNIPLMVESDKKEEIFEFNDPNEHRKIIDRFTASYDFVNQLEHDNIVLEEYREGSLTKKVQCKETLSYYFPRELKILLESEDLIVFHEQGSLNRNIPLDQNADQLVLFCKKRI